MRYTFRPWQAQGDRRWVSFGVSWRPDWKSGSQELYRGIVRRKGLKVGPFGFYLLYVTRAMPEE